jgi:hypothetical protein
MKKLVLTVSPKQKNVFVIYNEIHINDKGHFGIVCRVMKGNQNAMREALGVLIKLDTKLSKDLNYTFKIVEEGIYWNLYTNVGNWPSLASYYAGMLYAYRILKKNKKPLRQVMM